jgi:2-keto-4-pentenoate hydratase/2-oxohepta-3-ene-1,7-dioic acid hydratase in catechol pathway
MKILRVGRNHAEHAAELGDELLIFGKFENTLGSAGGSVANPVVAW